MPRAPRPWRRKFCGNAWYAQVGGQKIRIGDASLTYKDAQHELARLVAMHGAGPRQVNPPFAIVADQFLAHAEREVSQATYGQYRYKLDSAVKVFGKVRAADLRPSHVSRWLAGKDWSQATRRGGITAVKAALNFAVRERMIPENPLRDLERPPMPRSEVTLTVKERSALLSRFDDSFRDLLAAMQETGARPSEIYRLEAQHIDWEKSVAVMPGKTTGATGKPRTLVFTARMLKLCKRLAEEHPIGPLFRNRDGRPWTANAVRCRFRTLRESGVVGDGVTAKAFRHSYITDGLERGVPVAAMAELAGHSDWKMVQSVYSKLHERREALRKAAERAAASKPGTRK